jgi:hypothetical protein
MIVMKSTLRFFSRENISVHVLGAIQDQVGRSVWGHTYLITTYAVMTNYN